MLFHLLITIVPLLVLNDNSIVGVMFGEKKFKGSFAYQEIDLARPKNNTFWSYAESERVRFSNPMAWLERAFWSTKKNNHIQVDRDLKRLKTHDIYLPPPRKMKPHQVLPRKHSMKVQSEFRRSIILIVTQMDWLAFVKSATTKKRLPNWVLCFKSSSCAVSSASSSSHMMSKLPSPLSFFIFTLDWWGWLGRCDAEMANSGWILGEFLCVGLVESVESFF